MVSNLAPVGICLNTKQTSICSHCQIKSQPLFLFSISEHVQTEIRLCEIRWILPLDLQTERHPISWRGCRSPRCPRTRPGTSWRWWGRSPPCTARSGREAAATSHSSGPWKRADQPEKVEVRHQMQQDRKQRVRKHPAHITPPPPETALEKNNSNTTGLCVLHLDLLLIIR